MQQITLLLINTEKGFGDNSNILEDYVVNFDGLVVSEGVTDHADVCRGRCGNNTLV